jgi:lipopolysaccharide transport system ATP-binding protein
VPLSERVDRVGDGRIRFTSLHFENAAGETVSAVRSGEDCNIVFHYVCHGQARFDDVVVATAITDHSGRFLLHHRSNFTNQLFQRIPPEGELVCRMRRLPLAYGQYSVNAHIGIGEVAADSIYNAAALLVEPGNFFGTSSQGVPEWCPILNDADWSLRP